MKHWLIGLFALLSSPVLAQQIVPTIAYDSVPNPLQLPANLYFGEVTGVAVNSKRHVFVLSRGNTTGPAYAAAAAQLLEFGPDGRFVREIGHNLYAWAFGHTVKVDPNDNISVTDKGSDRTSAAPIASARFQARLATAIRGMVRVCIASPPTAA
jgi:hypothetical protein